MIRSNVQRNARGITHARCANFRHRENRNRANLKLRCAGAVITVLQTQDNRTTHALARTACFIIFLVFYKHALHGWSISTLLSTYLILRCGPYQLIALSPCLLNFLSLSMLHYPLPFSFRPRK